MSEEEKKRRKRLQEIKETMWRKGRQEGERLEDNKIPRIEEMEKTLQQIEEMVEIN